MWANWEPFKNKQTGASTLGWMRQLKVIPRCQKAMAVAQCRAVWLREENLQKTSRIQESVRVEFTPMRKLMAEHVKILPSSSFDGMNIKRDELVFPSSDMDSLWRNFIDQVFKRILQRGKRGWRLNKEFFRKNGKPIPFTLPWVCLDFVVFKPSNLCRRSWAAWGANYFEFPSGWNVPFLVHDFYVQGFD